MRHPLEILLLEVTGIAVGDAPLLPELLRQLSANETLLSVSGDGAYNINGAHEVIAWHLAAAITQTRESDRFPACDENSRRFHSLSLKLASGNRTDAHRRSSRR
ncbi:hypothetical protein QU481_18960 [Crenobacter sp. SG2303]|uniref:Transposase IS4-like domain-containing protein n=1 Tax=Crenobacter oryzisoli TaxID=3056844 RepID=A0ABT7XT75_9NEIS|nr:MULTISPECIES: hypothetical protein [unclassified Crenobacter]MDN0076928.1 hypothetical protein [Crenobacter sp. SG2303]MDN0083646.1 hypothetical protein [Crenobacter sp. SG2305]